MRTITLDLERMTSVPALHKYLRSALALPVYYGANLDALYDCLTEIVEPTQIIVPANVTDNEKLGCYGEQLLQVLQDAAEENENLQVTVKQQYEGRALAVRPFYFYPQACYNFRV